MGNVIGFVDFCQDNSNCYKWYYALKHKNGKLIGRSPNYSGYDGAKQAFNRMIKNLYKYSFSIERLGVHSILICCPRKSDRIVFTTPRYKTSYTNASLHLDRLMYDLKRFKNANRHLVHRKENWVRFSIIEERTSNDNEN